MFLLVFFLIFFVILILIFGGIVIVPQAYVYVIERLGAYYKTLEVGIHFRIPSVDRVSNKISLKEKDKQSTFIYDKYYSFVIQMM